jgi:hypothetical protein
MSTFCLDAWGLAQIFNETNVAVILGFLIVLHVGLAVGVQAGQALLLTLETFARVAAPQSLSAREHLLLILMALGVLTHVGIG